MIGLSNPILVRGRGLEYYDIRSLWIYNIHNTAHLLDHVVLEKLRKGNDYDFIVSHSDFKKLTSNAIREKIFMVASLEDLLALKKCITNRKIGTNNFVIETMTTIQIST